MMSLDVYLHTNKCECCGRSDEYYSSNITHNLNKMAKEAGIYEIVWRPDENGITKAKQLIDPLTKAINIMRADPERFKKFDAPNGWGLYEHFVPWLEEYLKACEIEPEAWVSVSR